MPLKESYNQVTVEGILAEKEYREIQKNGKEYLAGKLVFKVDDDTYVPVEFFSASMTQAGAPNKVYKHLQEVLKYKTIADHGIDEAARIRTTGKVEANDFVGRNGQLVSTFRLSSNFFNFVKDGAFAPKAEFMIEVCIVAMPEAEDGELPQIKGLAVGYNESAHLLTFSIPTPEAQNYIASNYNVGDTVKIGGKVKVDSERVEKVEEMGFGESNVQVYTKTKTSLHIIRGSEPYGEDEAMNQAEVKRVLNVRKTKVDEQIAQAAGKAQSGTSGSGKKTADFI